MPNISRVSYAPLTKGQLMEKIIQVRFKGIDYLKIGKIIDDVYHVFHGNIFKELLEELNVDFQMREDNEGPIATKDGEYELRGAGECWFKPDNVHQFQGRSAVYDKRINMEDLQETVPFFPKGICVQVEDQSGDGYIDLGIGEGRS